MVVTRDWDLQGLRQDRAALETGWLAGEAVWCERCCCSCTVPTGLADLSSTPVQGRQREDWRSKSLVRASWSVIKPRRGGCLWVRGSKVAGNVDRLGRSSLLLPPPRRGGGAHGWRGVGRAGPLSVREERFALYVG